MPDGGGGRKAERYGKRPRWFTWTCTWASLVLHIYSIHEFLLMLLLCALILKCTINLLSSQSVMSTSAALPLTTDDLDLVKHLIDMEVSNWVIQSPQSTLLQWGETATQQALDFQFIGLSNIHDNAVMLYSLIKQRLAYVCSFYFMLEFFFILWYRVVITKCVREFWQLITSGYLGWHIQLRKVRWTLS
jgi:hypothetical protein